MTHRTTELTTAIDPRRQLRGGRAAWWVGPGVVLGAIAAALFVSALPLAPAVAWTSLAPVIALVVALVAVAAIAPRTAFRTMVFAWLLVGLALVSVAGMVILVALAYL